MLTPARQPHRWPGAGLMLVFLPACQTPPKAPPPPAAPPVEAAHTQTSAKPAPRASSAVPAVFQPVRIGAREYVDGGLVSPVPVRFAGEMGAELVIAVDITSVPDGNATGDAVRMLLQTFAIMGRSINQFELREADVVLTPRLPGVSGADFASRKRSIQAGRDAALAALAELRSRIAAKTK